MCECVEMGRKTKLEKQKYLKKREITATITPRPGSGRTHLALGKGAFITINDNVDSKAQQRIFKRVIDVYHCVKDSHSSVFRFSFDIITM